MSILVVIIGAGLAMLSLSIQNRPRCSGHIRTRLRMNEQMWSSGGCIVSARSYNKIESCVLFALSVFAIQQLLHNASKKDALVSQNVGGGTWCDQVSKHTLTIECI